MNDESLIPPVRRRSEAPDVFAPDGSEIRLLADSRNGAGKSSTVEVALAAGQVSRPVYHRTVEETWYILAGRRAGLALSSGRRCSTRGCRGGGAGRRAGDPDGVELPVRRRAGRRVAVPVPHNACVAGRGRGGAGGARRAGGADGVASRSSPVAAPLVPPPILFPGGVPSPVLAVRAGHRGIDCA